MVPSLILEPHVYDVTNQLRSACRKAGAGAEARERAAAVPERAAEAAAEAGLAAPPQREWSGRCETVCGVWIVDAEEERGNHRDRSNYLYS